MGKKNKVDNDIAYIIEGPQEHLTLEIRRSANAWWMNSTKVYKLIEAFDNLYSTSEACAYAGITKRQYIYFIQTHPLFQERKQYQSLQISMGAKKVWVDAIRAGDVRAAARWLSKTQPETFGRGSRK